MRADSISLGHGMALKVFWGVNRCQGLIRIKRASRLK
jgi:hypothetical protein